MGIGDWGLGVGGWAPTPPPPIPNPQSPIPNPQQNKKFQIILIIIKKINNKLLFIKY
jgi:hypothetical protein